MSAADVVVSRASLRGMRSLVAGVVAGIVLLIGGLVMMGVESYQRCEAGNEFRRRDLPAAFDLHDQHLGRALGANDVQVAEFEAEFQAELDRLFPERDCSLL